MKVKSAKAIRFVVATLAVWTVLAVIGALMAPPWQVRPYTDHLVPDTPDTAIVSTRSGGGTPIGTYAVRESTVTVPLTDTVSVQAIVREPVGAPEGRPAVLMLHGAGTGRADEVYGDIAPQLASAGIVTMVPDKRLDNYGLLHRDYVGMAHDYEQELDVLRAMPGVDPGRTGVYAESEGTWISSVMTAERPDLAFSIIVSAPVYSGRLQMTAAATTYFADTGVPDAIRADIPKLAMLDFSLVRLDYADFDALPNYARLTQPALVVYGTLDPSMPIEQGALEIRNRAWSGAGNGNVTLRYYATNHQLRTGSRISEPDLPLDADYTRDLAAWISGVAAGTTAGEWRTPMTAGAQPNQEFAVPQSGAMASGPLSLHSLTSLAVLMAGGPALLLLAGIMTATAALTRKRAAWRREATQLAGAAGTDVRPEPGFGRGTATRLATRLAALGGGTAAALALTAGYLGLMVTKTLRLEPDPPLFGGGWIMMRCLSVAVAALWALVLLRLRDARRDRHDRSGSHRFDRAVAALTVAGAALTTGALAFWGMFAL